MKEIVTEAMEMKPNAEILEKFKKLYPELYPDVNKDTSSVKQLVVLGQVAKAIRGDTYAFTVVKGLIGEEMTAPPGDSGVQSSDGKIDFDAFCINASYPPAYAKQKEFIEFAFSGGVRMVEAARGYGKTDYVAILGVAYRIYENPKKTFIIINKDNSKAKTTVSEIARCLKANGIDLSVDSTSRVCVKGLVGKQENAKAMSVRMSPKQNHPDFIICDDIVDIKDKYSKAERKFIRDYYEALTGLTNNIIFLGQPVFHKDLYSEIKPLIKVMSLPHGSIPELDHDLEARRAAGVSKEFIDANYHLRVSADSSCPFAGIEEVNFFPSGTSFMWIDPSDGGGDDTAISVMSSNFENLIFAGFCFNKAWYKCDKEIGKIWKMYNSSKGGFETNGLGNQPVIILRQNGFNFAGRKTTENKEAKIQNAATYKNNIKLSTFIPENDEDLAEANKLFNKQVKEYEYETTEHDDAPDNIASSMIYTGIIKMGDK